MARPLRLYNTLSRQVEDLHPLKGDEVSLYTCGPTVYGRVHIGNLRCYVYEDILQKTLERLGYRVRRVMNITDVGHLTSDADEGEDKLEVGARRDRMTAWEVARRYEASFWEDMGRLNIARPETAVRVTEAIPQQIAFIQDLEAKGFVYRLADGIYFDSSKVPDYGRLARLDVEGLRAGARVAVQEGKRNPTDFVLWKFSPPGGTRDMEWESPWGKGFPGWHIECSAIIYEKMGEEIDIHCGGADHIPVHHTNEIAQSWARTGKPLAQIWSHCAFLQVDGGKMGKSLGNAYTLGDIEDRGFDPLAFRLYTYSASYRAQLNFTWEGLEAAAVALRRLRGFAAQWKAAGGEAEPAAADWQERLTAAAADDLNVPEALALIWEMAKAPLDPATKLAVLRDADTVLGLDLEKEEHIELPAAVNALVAEREAARQAKQWGRADELRGIIESSGYQVEDRPEGVKISRKESLEH